MTTSFHGNTREFYSVLMLDTRPTRSGIQILPIYISTVAVHHDVVIDDPLCVCSISKSFHIVFFYVPCPPALEGNPFQPYYAHTSNMIIIRAFKPFCFVPSSWAHHQQQELSTSTTAVEHIITRDWVTENRAAGTHTTAAAAKQPNCSR